MGDMIEDDFSTVAPDILSPLEKSEAVFGPPKQCRHCGKKLEKLFDMYLHLNGSYYCEKTHAEPEEEQCQ